MMGAYDDRGYDVESVQCCVEVLCVGMPGRSFLCLS